MSDQIKNLTRKVASKYIDDTVIDFDRKLEVIGLAEPWLLTASASDLAADRSAFYRASLTYNEEGIARLNDAGMAELLDKCRTLSNLYNLSVHIPQGDLIVQKETFSNDHVTVFRRKMYEIACQRLDENRAELDAMQARYEAYFGKPKGAQRNDTCFEQLRIAYDKDRELKRKDDAMASAVGDAFTKYNVDPTYQPFIDEYTNAKNIRADIAISRYLLRKAYPELDSVSDGRITYRTRNSQILARMIKNFDRARRAQDEVRQKIDSGDMPLFKLEPIVEAAMAFYGITESSTTDFAKAVLEWLKSASMWDGVIKIGSTVISLATVAACFIPGVGVGAIIALGAIGAGADMVGAIYEFEMAEDLDDAAWSQQSGSNQLIANADAAKKEYIWGIVNLCLACVDLFLSGKEVVRVGRVMSKFSSVADGATFLNKIGDAKEAMRFVNRMDSLPNGNTVLQKLQYSTGDTTNEVVRFFNGLDEAELSRGIDIFNKYDTADDFVVNGVKTGKEKQAVNEILEEITLLDKATTKAILEKHGEPAKIIIDKYGTKDNIKGITDAFLGDKGNLIVQNMTSELSNGSGAKDIQRFFTRYGSDAGDILSRNGYPPPYWKVRPNYKSDQVEKVWELAKENPKNKHFKKGNIEYIQTENGLVIWDHSKQRNGQWDMGHLPDEKYSDWYDYYMKGKISKEEFLEWYQTAEHYEPQTIQYNRSHQGE